MSIREREVGQICGVDQWGEHLIMGNHAEEEHIKTTLGSIVTTPP